MIFKFCENVFHGIRERKAVVEERLKSGCFETMRDYKGVVGRLHGLSEGEEIIKKIYKDMFDYKPENNGAGYDEV